MKYPWICVAVFRTDLFIRPGIDHASGEGCKMVMFPPDSTEDREGWVRALLTDLAGWSDSACELLEALWDVQGGKITEWTGSYNVFRIELNSSGAVIHFIDDSCPVPLDMLASIVAKHLRLQQPPVP